MRTDPGGVRFGAAMIVGGMAVIGFTDNFVRVIAEDAGLWQFHLFRSAMALPLLALAAVARRAVAARRGAGALLRRARACRRCRCCSTSGRCR